MKFLAGLQVLVIGLGESGLAMARWCVRNDAQVQVWDSRAEPPQAAALRTELPAVALASGEPMLPGGVQLVLKSPGLAPHDVRIAPLLAAAREAGVPVLAELDLFTRALAELKVECGYAPQLLAVTGTNGKTTTTAMTALLVQRAGRRTARAGNIMPTMLERLSDALDAPQDEWPQVWVLELSSFQLADAADAFAPDAAAMLNLTQDHLDWHGSMAGYAAAKLRVFGPHTTRVLNRDDGLVAAMEPAPAVVPAKPGRGKPTRPAPGCSVLRFGLGVPTRAGDFGLVTEHGMAWLVRAMPSDETVKRRPGRSDEEPEEIHLQRLMPADALRVRGRHNAANALAALALAVAIGCPLAPMLHGLREYAGEPHRVQWVATIGGVEAFDDTKGTNVGATVAALEGLGADKAPGKLAVILGGDGKGQDFSPLFAPVQRYARGLALIGRDAAVIEAALAGCQVPMQRRDSLPDAVAWCFEQAKSGDAVLLSPACASLDMFRNYVHRGEVFVAAVHERAAERGEVV